MESKAYAVDWWSCSSQENYIRAKTARGCSRLGRSGEIVDIVVHGRYNQIGRMVTHINQGIELRKQKRKNQKKTNQSYHKSTTSNEIRALIGLPYMADVQKSGNLHMEELWRWNLG